MQRVFRLGPFHEILAPVQIRHPPPPPPAADDGLPVAAVAQPGRGRVPEGAGIDSLIRGDDRVLVGFDPLGEIRVGEVGRKGVVLNLAVLGVDSGV